MPEHDGADLALGGERVDVAAQPLALGHRLGDGDEELGQVAADLPLDADRHDGPGEVAGLHPGGDAVERLLEGTAEAGLGDDPAQLPAHRLGDLLRHRLHALHERVAGAQRAGQQLEGVGEQRLELLAPAVGRGSDTMAGGIRATTTTPMRAAMGLSATATSSSATTATPAR